MNIDDIFVEIGEFGWYQRIRYLLLCLPAVICGFHAMLAVFLTAIPDYRCRIPEWTNDTFTSDHVDALDASIPKVYNNNTCQIEYSRCKVFSNVSHWATSPGEVDCKSWVFDQSTYTATVMTEFNLGCGDEDYKSLAQILYMVGVLWGSLIWGLISDIFGRKRSLPLACILTIGCSLGTAWAPDIISFMILRMLVSANASGIYICAFVLAIETVGPSARMWAGICINFFFAAGVMILPGIAYALRDWRHLQIACSVPMAMFFFCYPFLVESPHWLQSKGRYKEAIKVLDAIAKGNKKPMPEANTPKNDPTQPFTTPHETPHDSGKIWHMFTSPVLLIRTLIIFWNWAVVTMVYYGLTLRSGSMTGNAYLNVFFMGLIEFPAYVLCLLLLNRVGRKKVVAVGMIFGGISCTCTLFPIVFGESAGCKDSDFINGMTGSAIEPVIAVTMSMPFQRFYRRNDWLGNRANHCSDLQIVLLVLSLLGKLGVSSAFASIYVFSSELFPTVVRNGTVGMCSMVARLGGIVSAYVADLDMYVPGKIGQVLPLIIFGICAMSAGLLVLLLPETLNQNLPETIDDAKAFGRNTTHTISTVTVLETSKDNQGNLSHLKPAFVEDKDPV